MNNRKFVVAFIFCLTGGLLSVYIDKLCPLSLTMPFPVILIGGIGIFCIVNFIRYSRKPTSEVLLYSIAGFLVSALVIFIAFLLSSLSKLETAIFINMIEFKLNYITLILSLLAGLIVADLLNIKKQKSPVIELNSSIISENSAKLNYTVEPIKPIKQMALEKDEIIKMDAFIANPKTLRGKPDKIMPEIDELFDKLEKSPQECKTLREIKHQKDEYKDEIIKIVESAHIAKTIAKQEEKINPAIVKKQSTDEELKKEKELNSFFDEDYELKTKVERDVIFEFIEEKNVDSLFVNEWEELQETPVKTVSPICINSEDLFNLFEENLGDLPEIKLDENQSSVKKQIKFGIEGVKELTPYQFIPENLRLANNRADRKDEKDGKITAIGKLIINERDLENIIELGAIGQAGAFRAKIVTVESGEKSTELFSKICEICPKIKAVSLIDKSGFILKSSIGDNHKEQTIGAISAHAFMTLQNYASQIAFTDVDNIIFNTFTSSLMLKSIEDKIFAVEFTDNIDNFKETRFAEILKAQKVNYSDILLLKNDENIIASIFVDMFGNCQEKNEELKKLASIASSIFENLRIFLINIQTQPLDSLVLFEKDKLLVIKKTGEQLAVFIVNGNKLLRLEQTIEKVLTVLNKGI